eukprot:gb/GEZN01000440.1/.p1 GENE.gb/GEZN01000440.1/~~gb/GEZN01000440.1/.p1  ORF type:complete len:1265 (+),score=120.97 gb/GEZN01000440.1/:56-3850(+)
MSLTVLVCSLIAWARAASGDWENSIQLPLHSLTDERGQPFFSSDVRRTLATDSSRLRLSFTLQGYKSSDEVLEFDLVRLPSVISDDAVIHLGKDDGEVELGSPHHTPIYGSHQGSMTLVDDDVLEGVLIHPTDQVYMHVKTGAQGRTLHLNTEEFEPWRCGHSPEYHHASSGNFPGNQPQPAPQKTQAEAAPTNGHMRRREMAVVERWTNCYNRDEVPRQLNVGLGVGSNLWTKLGGTSAKVQAFLSGVIANSNVIYSTQLNINLKLAGMFFQQTGGGPSWNGGSSCSMTINQQLDNLVTWVRNGQPPSDQGIWHVIDDCPSPTGTIGLAWGGTICNKGYNTGVNLYTSSTWRTVAHEMGHNFGASHSFQEGQGRTGGIMDYGDGKLNGEYQFNTKYNKAEVCTFLNTVVDSCSFFSIASSSASCGNGVVETAAGEQCECASGTTCNCCNNCKLPAGGQCTPDGISLNAQCCNSQCKYEKTTKICQLEGGRLTGFCSRGTCTVTQCDSFGNFGMFCGMHSDNDCKIMCLMDGNRCDPMEGWQAITGGPLNILSGTPCGSDGMGTCNAGSCIGGGNPSPAPTKPPTWTPPTPTRVNGCDRYLNSNFLVRSDVSGGANTGFSRAQCDTACANAPTCHSFVWSQGNGYCALYSTVMTTANLVAGPGQETNICPDRGMGTTVNDCDKWTNRYFTGTPDLGSPSADKLGITLQACWDIGCGGFTLMTCDQACRQNARCHSFLFGQGYCELWSAAKGFNDLASADGYDMYICPARAATTTTLPPATATPQTCVSHRCPNGWTQMAGASNRVCNMGCTDSFCCQSGTTLSCQTVTCYNGGFRTCASAGQYCICRNGWGGPTCQIPTGHNEGSDVYQGNVSVEMMVQLNHNISKFDTKLDINRFLNSLLIELELADPPLPTPPEAFTKMRVVVERSSQTTVTLSFELVEATTPTGTVVKPLAVSQKIKEIANYTRSSYLVGMSVVSEVEQVKGGPPVLATEATTQRAKLNEMGLYLAIAAAGLVFLIGLIVCLCVRRSKYTICCFGYKRPEYIVRRITRTEGDSSIANLADNVHGRKSSQPDVSYGQAVSLSSLGSDADSASPGGDRFLSHQPHAIPEAETTSSGQEMENKSSILEWLQLRDPDTGSMYYYNTTTNVSTWDPPISSDTSISEPTRPEGHVQTPSQQDVAFEVSVSGINGLNSRSRPDSSDSSRRPNSPNSPSPVSSDLALPTFTPMTSSRRPYYPRQVSPTPTVNLPTDTTPQRTDSPLHIQ